MHVATAFGLAAFLTVSVAADASAGDVLYALKLGALAHDVPDLWSGFQVEHNAVDINVEAQFAAAWALPWGAIRPVIGGTINTRGDTSHGYIDARWQGDCPSGSSSVSASARPSTTARSAAQGFDPDKKWLGSRVLFHIPLEVGYRTDALYYVSVYFEHTSNADTVSIQPRPGPHRRQVLCSRLQGER